MTYPALDYDALLREAAQAATSSTIPNPSTIGGPPFTGLHLAHFFCNAVTNDTLGKIAHFHLAVSDHSARGALDPQAIELAKVGGMT